jgi:tRNA A37 N6-isopentenylltransferase MiaA
LDGELTEEEAIEEIVRVNMRYARRQMSWWRGRDEIRWFASGDEYLLQLRT